MNPFSVRQLSLGVVLGYLAGYAMTVAPGLLMAKIFLAWEQTLPIQALVVLLVSVLIAHAVIGALDSLLTVWLTEQHYAAGLEQFIGHAARVTDAGELSTLLTVDLYQCSRDFAIRAAMWGQFVCILVCCGVIFWQLSVALAYALVPLLAGALLVHLYRSRADAAGEAHRLSQGKVRLTEQLALGGVDLLRNPAMAQPLLLRMREGVLSQDAQARVRALNARSDIQSLQAAASALALMITLGILWLGQSRMPASSLVLVVSYLGTMSVLAVAVVDSRAQLQATLASRRRIQAVMDAPQLATIACFDTSRVQHFRFQGVAGFSRMTGVPAQTLEDSATKLGLSAQTLHRLATDGEGVSRGENLLAYLAAVHAVMGDEPWRLSGDLSGLDKATQTRVRKILERHFDPA